MLQRPVMSLARAFSSTAVSLQRTIPAWQNTVMSTRAANTLNPIRAIVDHLKVKPNPELDVIPLSIGDPTVFGYLATSDEANEAVIKAVKSKKFNGYGPSAGLEMARSAVADYTSVEGAKYDTKDVVLTSGCSHALDLAFSVLANPHVDNVLIPRPYFSHYECLLKYNLINVKFYDLDAEKNWEADLDSIRREADDNTKAIIVNNPSNPCGSVFELDHLKDIMDTCEDLKLPVIADEIYADMVFPGSEFKPMAALNPNVPVITVGGLAKQYMIPGWRMGWILSHDNGSGILDNFRQGISDVSATLMGPNTLVQAALPDILKTSDTYHKEVLNKLAENASFTEERLSTVPGLKVIKPQGAMYNMIGVDVDAFNDTINSDADFYERLIEDQAVVVLPGQCFGMKNFIRIVLAPPKDVLSKAFDRIEDFCHKNLA